MKTPAVNTPILIMCMIIIISSVNVFFPTDMIHTDESHVSLHGEPFTLAATYEPGEYPSGLTLVDGDVLNATDGGSFNVAGNFTIVSGATVTIVPGYKIVVYADNIIINGTLDCNGAGYSGGAGGTNFENHANGSCDPISGGGVRGALYGGGGGGGAYGSNGTNGTDGYTGAGGVGGLAYGQEGLEGPKPNLSDISMGAGGGGGASGEMAGPVPGGAGGNGGGGVYLEAEDKIIVDGTIACDGEIGGNAHPAGDIGGGGGGGGAGGGILLSAGYIEISGTLSTLGGGGGSGGGTLSGGDGGIGSGGRIKIAYKYLLNTTVSTILEGSGGTLYTYQHDIVKPTLALAGPMNGTQQFSGTLTTVNISDSRELQSVSYNWDDETNTTIALSNSSYLLTTYVPTPDGEHILEIFAQDSSDNWNYMTLSYITDDTSPTITLESPTNNTVHRSGSIIDIEISDTNSVDQVLYNWDGLGDNESISEPFELLLPSDEGPHNLTVYAVDVVGNWESILYSFVTDDTPPIVTSPDDIVYTEGTAGHNFTWLLSDLYPGSYIVTLDGSLIQSGDWSSGAEVEINADALSVGMHVYTIMVFDEANNLFTDTVIVTVEAPPTITTTTTTTGTTTTPTSPLFNAETLTLMLASGIGVAAVVVIIVLIINRKRG